MKSLEALENITDWIEYFTRLDYVDPIVRGEVQKNFYDAYHKTRPELELIKKDLEEKEKQDKILNALLKNGNYRYDYDEWDGMRGNQYIMICITDKDECFEEVKELLDEKNK